VSLVYTGAIARVVDEVSVFNGDDITTSWQARTLPFQELLFTPIDVHTVPLHRVFTYLLSQLAPLNDRVALAVMLALHLGSVWLLYRTLEAVRPSLTNVFVSACYATFVHLGPLFTWWVASVHRLPFLCCLGGAVWAYVLFRRRPSLKLALLVILGLVAGLGFFEKAMFIPFVLCGVEVGLRFTNPGERTEWKKPVLLLGAELILVALYMAWWRHTTSGEMGAVTTDPEYLLQYSRLSWAMLMSGVVGNVNGGQWLGVVVTGALVVGSCALYPRNAVLFLIAGALAWASLVSTGLPTSRATIWGVLATLGSRYYPDVMYVVCIFAGIALSNAASALSVRRPLTPRLESIAAALSFALLGLLATNSYVNGARAIRDDVNNGRMRKYLDNVRAGIGRIEREHGRLLFIDGMLPQELQLFRDVRAHHKTLLVALGTNARITRPVPGAYLIDALGNVRELRRR
jgi:hypothetical protein